MAQLFAAALTLLYWIISARSFQLVRHVKPGASRFLSVLPLLCANLLVPLLYDYKRDPLTVMTVFSMLCLSAFKVCAWCINRGPLCLHLTFAQTLAILHFPVMPVEVFTPKSGMVNLPEDDATKLLFRCAWKTVLVGAINQLLMSSLLPGLLYTYMLGMSMCFFLGGVQDLMAYIAIHWLKLRVAPLFDQPWMSTSLSEYWSHRWNVPGSLIFRVMVYDPVMEGRLIKPDDSSTTAPPKTDSNTPQSVPPLKRQLAAIGCFALSGIGHELMYWYAMRRFSGWWLAFFVLQVPLIAVERATRKAMRNAGLKVPAVVDRLRVNLLVALTSHLLFFGPATAAGLTERINHSIQASFEGIRFPMSGQRILPVV